MLEDEHVVTLSVFLDHFADIALVFANSQADLRTQELNSLIRSVFSLSFGNVLLATIHAYKKKGPNTPLNHAQAISHALHIHT